MDTQDEGVQYLDAFFVDDAAVHFQNSRFDSASGWQHRETDVDRIRTFRVQDRDLFLDVATFLYAHEKQTANECVLRDPFKSFAPK